MCLLVILPEEFQPAKPRYKGERKEHPSSACIYLGMNAKVEMIRPNICLPTGLRGRLLLAFGGISSFAVLAAIAGLVAFVSGRQSLEDTTARRVPETVGAME